MNRVTNEQKAVVKSIDAPMFMSQQPTAEEIDAMTNAILNNVPGHNVTLENQRDLDTFERQFANLSIEYKERAVLHLDSHLMRAELDRRDEDQQKTIHDLINITDWIKSKQRV